MDNPFVPLIAIATIALYIFLFVIIVKFYIFLCDFPKYMKHLPNAIAEKMIEKLREEEKRKQTEQNTNQ